MTDGGRNRLGRTYALQMKMSMNPRLYNLMYPGYENPSSLANKEEKKHR